MFLNSGTPDLVRNTDIEGELRRLAEAASFEWISSAANGLSEVERGMRPCRFWLKSDHPQRRQSPP